MRGPLQGTVERIRRVHHDVGERGAPGTIGRPPKDTSTVERVVGWAIPAQLLPLIEPEPRDACGKEGRVGICSRSARRQIKVKRKAWLHGDDK